MRRYHQSLEELLNQLSPVATGWQDAHSEAVIQRLQHLPAKSVYSRADLVALLDNPRLSGKERTEHFNQGMTTVRLFLELSKDEFMAAFRSRVTSGVGVSQLTRNPDAIYEALEQLGVLERMAAIVNTPTSWVDLLAAGCDDPDLGQWARDALEALGGAGR